MSRAFVAAGVPPAVEGGVLAARNSVANPYNASDPSVSVPKSGPLPPGRTPDSTSWRRGVRRHKLPLFACFLALNRLKPRRPFEQDYAMTNKQLQALARAQGTPIVVIDHDVIRENYAAFKKHLPKIQCYYAVKANAEPAIVR